MYRPYKFILLFLPFCLSFTTALSQEVDKRSTFSAELAQLKDYFHIPGIAAVVEQDGRIIYEHYGGYADRESHIPVDSSTLFPIASITKVFSGILAMKLEEQGKLSLADPEVSAGPGTCRIFFGKM